MKSSALRALCPVESWFSDDLPLGIESKEVIERTAGKWIIEAAEMHGNRGRETEQLKAFLSRQVDGPVRMAYARRSTKVHRQFILIGTTNNTSYLKDSTGGRRFWPIRVRQFNVAGLLEVREQLWAEASLWESTGESIRLAPELWAAAGEEQERRRASDPWEPVLEPLFEGRNVVPVREVWDALGLETSWRDNRHAARVDQIVGRLGYQKRKVRLDAKPVLCWCLDAAA
jgi:predicted P-loop ATPase